jgi:uncharacterized membrane protein
MSYVIAYVAVLIVFGTIDAAWLSTMGPMLYRPALGDILAPGLRIAPTIAFYLMYPVGVVVFAVLPALRAQTPFTAAALALLFGALAYATYDLTNYATLRMDLRYAFASSCRTPGPRSQSAPPTATGWCWPRRSAATALR